MNAPPIQEKQTANVEIFLYKTQIKSTAEIRRLAELFQCMDKVLRWSVDMHDVDRVLKVVFLGHQSEHTFQEFLRSEGIKCQILQDQ